MTGRACCLCVLVPLLLWSHRLDDFGAVFNKMIKTCGHPSKGVVTPCTLTALKITTAAAKSMMAAEANEGIVPDIQPVPLGFSGPIAVRRTAKPREGVVAAVQPAVPAAVDATDETADSIPAAAGAALGAASQVPVVPDAEPVVAQQAEAVSAADGVTGGKRKAARRLV